jgi:hypothetical protein
MAPEVHGGFRNRRRLSLSLDDARLAIARYYDFLDWASLAAYVEAIAREGPVLKSESAVEAVVNGDLATLEDALRRDPALVRARSNRVCCFDPPVHRATLLHYVAVNGVEAYRQKTPANAVEIAHALLQAGARVTIPARTTSSGKDAHPLYSMMYRPAPLQSVQ